MSVRELRISNLSGKLQLHIGTFAGQITITPIVDRIGDTISLDRNQAHLLMLFLQEHLK